MKVETREQAEAALSAIGRIEARIKIIEGEAEEAKARIDGEAAGTISGLDRLRAERRAALEVYARATRQETKRGLQKTIKLKCGDLQFKDKKPRLELDAKEETVIATARADQDPAVRACVVKKEALDKEALKRLPLTCLKRLGARILAGVEEFYVKPRGQFQPYEEPQAQA